jgi:hypothetical protein
MKVVDVDAGIDMELDVEYRMEMKKGFAVLDLAHMG